MTFDTVLISKLLVLFLPFLFSLYFHQRGDVKLSLWLLFVAALLLRMFMCTLDPFLHEWDERFHAVVAKNMMGQPFMPTLHKHAYLPYDYREWCCNHIWVHKQPLFLWQMALSMKVFGVNEFGLRFPSALLGAIMVPMVYRIAKVWTRDTTIAYCAAFMVAMSYYILEMTSGRFGLDHNDFAFTFYVTASIWAYCEYTLTQSRKWLVAIGIFVGAAILNKWLTGLLVYAGWGITLICDSSENRKLRNYIDMAISLAVSVVVFLPWQIYTAYRFPLETAWEHEFNVLHILVPLDGHTGEWTFYLDWLGTHYGTLLLPFMVIGLLIMLVKYPPRLTLGFLFMVVILYTFFSFIVATKMPAFTFTLASLLFITAATGFVHVYRWLLRRFSLPSVFSPLFMLAMGLYVLNLPAITYERSQYNEWRNAKIHDAEVYRNLNEACTHDIVINMAKYDNIDLMFWQDTEAYTTCPGAGEVDSLLRSGVSILALNYPAVRPLPAYITNDKRITVITPVVYVME